MDIEKVMAYLLLVII